MLRYALSPRWIPGHLFALALMAVCVRLGAWQWSVGHQPLEPGGPARFDLQNSFYAFQWVFFAGVVAWFWWRYLRDERQADREWDAEQAEIDAATDQAPEGSDQAAG